MYDRPAVVAHLSTMDIVAKHVGARLRSRTSSFLADYSEDGSLGNNSVLGQV